jgi:hypothetical protein
VVALAFLIRRHYRSVARDLDRLYRVLDDLPATTGGQAKAVPAAPMDPRAPTAIVLVGSYGGVGIHTVLNVCRSFPGYFANVVFVSVGVIDSGEFKGEHAIEELRTRTAHMLARYVLLAAELGVPATSRLAVGTEAVSAAEKLCLEVGREFSHAVYFAGKLIFEREKWYHRLLHNETALAIENRLRWMGKTMVTLPIRVREPA